MRNSEMLVIYVSLVFTNEHRMQNLLLTFLQGKCQRRFDCPTRFANIALWFSHTQLICSMAKRREVKPGQSCFAFRSWSAAAAAGVAMIMQWQPRAS